MDLKAEFINMIFEQNKRQGAKYIAIFGAGKNGIKFLNEINAYKIKVDFFCDNDKNKHGTSIMGVPCISFQELCKYKNDVSVLVSPAECESIYNSLHENEFKYIISDKFIEILKFMPKGYSNFFDIGHYYSLYPNIEEISREEKDIFANEKEIKDIDLNEQEQLKVFQQMTELYSNIPKWEDISVPLATTLLRHRYNNCSLSHGDAIGLHCMLRIIKPQRMIEVGSGFTSAVTLDTNEFYLNNSIDLTFIEPYPDTIKAILKKDDKINLVEKGLQDVPLDVFTKLNEGDILFIDSTHVSKINSDVNYLFFEILPRLNKGVYIHLHDIFYPFEYPKEWIYDGMVWNELYLLRGFLQNNHDYSIVFFQNMMEKRHMDIFKSKWPLDIIPHGGSIWLRKN